MVPEPVAIWLNKHGYGDVVRSSLVGGGCINNGIRLETDSGMNFFLKTNATAPPDMFAREVEGLMTLKVADGPRVPETFLHGNSFLLLEDLAPVARAKHYWEDFGRKFAALHNNTKDQFGFEQDNYIGSTPQPNTWTQDGYVFFAHHRLNYQAQRAAKAGLLSSVEVEEVAKLSQRLPELIPHQPASLLHGDLWSGNAIADENGQPAIIDPAAYYGWAEADLAMTTLFGGFHADFYQAYTEARPLEIGWKDRFPLYNLYHLLNHLNLFGRGYHGQVIQIIEQYR